MPTYNTKQYQQWDEIAFAQTGSEYTMGDLIALNSTARQNVVYTLSFDAGIKLNLPFPPQPRPLIGPPPWRTVTTV